MTPETDVINLAISIAGLLLSAIPLGVLPTKIRAGLSKYMLIYLFLFLYYLSLTIYFLWPDEPMISIIYIFQMLFFLNIYKAYLQKGILFAISLGYLIINALAILFTFYFISFNLFELIRAIVKKERTSPLVLSSTVLFEFSVIVQLFEIVINHTYLSSLSLALFLGGALLFIIPGLGVAYEKEEI